MPRNMKSYLAHHGILGQKWGIRRFQNKDGTRTNAGKEREARQAEFNQYRDNVNKVFDDVITNPEYYKNSFKKVLDAQNAYENGPKTKDSYNRFRKESDNDLKKVKKAEALIINELNKRGLKYKDGTDISVDDAYKTNVDQYGKETLFYDALTSVFTEKIVEPAAKEYRSSRNA